MAPATPIVVGSGLAGLLTALGLASRGAPCRLLTAGSLGSDSSSELAQGGLAAAIGPGDDARMHAADTVAAGAGLCDPGIVEAVTAAAPVAVARLTALGARFDRHADGQPALGLEGAHSRPRIVHTDGDGSGAELVRAAAAAVRSEPLVTVLEGVKVHALTTARGRVGGVVAGDACGSARHLAAPAVVLATGGIGALYAHTTNPTSSWGAGLALALRAGAVLRDVELVQFHPTALDVPGELPGGPMTLVSEAVRGAGARLVLADGSAAVPDPLAARDVVARAVWAHLVAGRGVYLDVAAALGDAAAARFPALASACARAGLDPRRDLVPVRPAAHYHMGGVEVDRRGRTGVAGLWAVGEVASTGLHGANRLASNSLLEAVVCAEWAAADIAARAHLGAVDGRDGRTVRLAGGSPAAPDPGLRAAIESSCGVLREAGALSEAVEAFGRDAAGSDPHLVALALARAALARVESRGGHARTDAPDTAALATSTRIGLGELLAPAASSTRSAS